MKTIIKNDGNQLKRKAPYISPELIVTHVYLESAIAGGSAKVSPNNDNNKVFESWENDADDERTLEW